MGGTGKTPVVAHLASTLLAAGFKPAIISRGYGGAAGNKVNVVSNGKEVFLDAKAAGDEPCFLGHSLPGIHVLTGIVRILPCRYAIEKSGCNVLILDDGFQHLAVQRDLDLVLFSAATLAGNSRVFPGGDLREPISALKRCSAFLITGVTEELSQRATQFKELLQKRFPTKSVFFASYKPVATRSLDDGSIHSIEALPSPLFAFCGIGQPQLFQKTLTHQNIELSGFLSLRDHQAFIPSLLKKIAKQAERSGAQGIITTEKDLVKIKKENFNLPCFSLQMEVVPDEEFTLFINEQIKHFNS
jgi:tetraacyldisaccharide 4'-kinase